MCVEVVLVVRHHIHPTQQELSPVFARLLKKKLKQNDDTFQSAEKRPQTRVEKRKEGRDRVAGIPPLASIMFPSTLCERQGILISQLNILR